MKTLLTAIALTTAATTASAGCSNAVLRGNYVMTGYLLAAYPSRWHQSLEEGEDPATFRKIPLQSRVTFRGKNEMRMADLNMTIFGADVTRPGTSAGRGSYRLNFNCAGTAVATVMNDSWNMDLVVEGTRADPVVRGLIRMENNTIGYQASGVSGQFTLRKSRF